MPVHSLLDAIAESSAAVAPIKPAIPFFVSGLLHGIGLLDIVDHGSDPVRELSYGFTKDKVQPGINGKPAKPVSHGR